MDIPVAVFLISLIIVLGSVGNIISIKVWGHGKRCRTANCGPYIWSLALNDLFLLSIFGTEFVLVTGGINIRDHYDVVCKVVMYGGQIAPQISAWITVAIAMERMLYMCFPIRMYKSNVKKRSIIVLSLIIAFSMTLNVLELIVPEIFTFHISDQNTSTNYTMSFCDITYSSELTEGYQIIRAISYGIFTFLLPLAIISTCNLVMLMKICTYESTSGRNVSQRRNLRNITKVVVCISGLHCISTFPYAIVQCSYYVKLPEINSEFAVISYFLNSGFNFAVYCLFSSEFRQDLKELFKGFCHNCQLVCQDKTEERSFPLTQF